MSIPDALMREIEIGVLARAGFTRRDEIIFRCPAEGHEDRHPSARWNPQKAVWRCDVCGVAGGAFNLADKLGIERPEKGGGDTNPPKHTRNTATPPAAGCTLAEYAEAKKLPIDFLRILGLSDILYKGKPAVRMAYRRRDGTESNTVRFRLQMDKSKPDARFVWKTGSKTFLYGLDQIEGFDAAYLILDEGESDTQTLLYHGVQALGLPGASNYNDERDAQHLEKFGKIYVVIEPDDGGEAVKKWLADSTIGDRAYLLDLAPYKDISEIHQAGEEVAAFIEAAKGRAIKWTDIQAEDDRQAEEEAWQRCALLAKSPNLLDRAADAVKSRGVVGLDRNIKIYYLALTSRVLQRPISAVIKGPSSAGKSYPLEETLKLFPEPAYLTLTGMSDKALVYSDEPLKHRFLIVFEAAGLSSDFATYLVRTLLSEGKLIYSTVEKTAEGLKPRKIVREGPTGFFATTTAVSLHAENETRMLSIPVTDSRDQTREIFHSLASPKVTNVDYEQWHALQTWIGHAEHRVVIPFAPALAELVPAISVRQRRDFGLVLSFIQTHAILYQAQRQRDVAGQIVATLDDYDAIRDLIHDLVSAGIGATIPETVRETVHAVAELTGVKMETLKDRVQEKQTERTTSVTEIAKKLKLDKSSASRRVKVATSEGYLINLEEKRGRPAQVTVGESLPENIDILPVRELLAECCSVAGDFEGVENPLPPTGTEDWEVF